MVTLSCAPEQILLLSPVHRKAVTVMRKAKSCRPQYLLIGFVGMMFAFSFEHSPFESSTLCTSYLNYPLAIVIVNYLNESTAYLLSYSFSPHHKWPNSTGDLRERNWETHGNNDSGGDPGSLGDSGCSHLHS